MQPRVNGSRESLKRRWSAAVTSNISGSCTSRALVGLGGVVSSRIAESSKTGGAAKCAPGNRRRVMTFLRHLVVSLVRVACATNIAEALLPLRGEPALTRRAIPDQLDTLTTVSLANKAHHVGRFGRRLPIAILLATAMFIVLFTGCTPMDDRGTRGFRVI